jgi:hypothetical protein
MKISYVRIEVVSTIEVCMKTVDNLQRSWGVNKRKSQHHEHLAEQFFPSSTAYTACDGMVPSVTVNALQKLLLFTTFFYIHLQFVEACVQCSDRYNAWIQQFSFLFISFNPWEVLKWKQ